MKYLLIPFLLVSLISCQEESELGCVVGTAKVSGERETIECLTQQQFNCAKELYMTGSNEQAYNAVLVKPVCSNGGSNNLSAWGNYTNHKWEKCGACD